MRRFATIAIMATMIACALSCTKELDYHRDDIKPMLTLNAQLSTAEDIHIVSLSISTDITVTKIKSGSVKCFVNGNSVGESWILDGDKPLHPSEDEFVWNPTPEDMNQTCYAFKASFKAGDVVRIEATANDGEYAAWSEVTVPEAPDFKVADTSSVWSKDKSRIDDLKFVLKGNDLKGKDSYYSINVYIPELDAHPRLDKGNDPILLDGGTAGDMDIFGTSDNSYNVFSDNLFKDGSFTLSFTVPSYWLMDIDENGDYSATHYGLECIQVLMNGISREEYHYLKSLSIYDNIGGGSGLTEPISFPDNVNGGIGIVSVANPTVATIYF